MTLIQFYNAVAENKIDAEVIAKAQELIAKDAADKQKAKDKRAEKASSKQADPNCAVALGFLGSEPMTGTALLERAMATGMTHGDKPLTKQYMATLMRPLVAAGKVVKTEIKVEGAKGKVVAYTLA